MTFLSAARCGVATGILCGSTPAADLGHKPHDLARQLSARVTPFCANGRRLDDYLQRHGFIAEDSLSFTSGAALTRYRFMGDMLWTARWPDGRTCLLAMGLMGNSNRPRTDGP